MTVYNTGSYNTVLEYIFFQIPKMFYSYFRAIFIIYYVVLCVLPPLAEQFTEGNQIMGISCKPPPSLPSYLLWHPSLLLLLLERNKSHLPTYELPVYNPVPIINLFFFLIGHCVGYAHYSTLLWH